MGTFSLLAIYAKGRISGCEKWVDGSAELRARAIELGQFSAQKLSMFNSGQLR